MKLSMTKKNDLVKIAGKRGLWVRRGLYKRDGGFCHLTSLMNSEKNIYVASNTKVELVK